MIFVLLTSPDTEQTPPRLSIDDCFHWLLGISSSLKQFHPANRLAEPLCAMLNDWGFGHSSTRTSCLWRQCWAGSAAPQETLVSTSMMKTLRHWWIWMASDLILLNYWFPVCDTLHEAALLKGPPQLCTTEAWPHAMAPFCTGTMTAQLLGNHEGWCTRILS